MAADAISQRRRAAAAVLGPVLEPAVLLQELWFQHEHMRGDAVSDIIGFVDAVARRHLLDAGTCKRLYAEFFKALRLPESQLPPDPWPAMQALRPAPAPAPLPVAAPVVAPAVPVAVAIQPVAAAMAAVRGEPPLAASAALQAALPASAPASDLPAEPPAVFGALLRAIVQEVHRYHREALDEVRKDALRALDGSRASAAARSAYREAWPRALQHDWQLRHPPADLAELLRVTYHALAEAFGRVGAEQILQRGLRVAESLPEARLFSPKRLMASM